jgi:hypothetical protein
MAERAQSFPPALRTKARNVLIYTSLSELRQSSGSPDRVDRETALAGTVRTAGASQDGL